MKKKITFMPDIQFRRYHVNSFLEHKNDTLKLKLFYWKQFLLLNENTLKNSKSNLIIFIWDCHRKLFNFVCQIGNSEFCGIFYLIYRNVILRRTKYKILVKVYNNYSSKPEIPTSCQIKTYPRLVNLKQKQAFKTFEYKNKNRCSKACEFKNKNGCSVYWKTRTGVQDFNLKWKQGEETREEQETKERTGDKGENRRQRRQGEKGRRDCATHHSPSVMMVLSSP